MRYVSLCVLVIALSVPGSAAAGTVVSAFYYPWFGTSSSDGDFAHWAQGGHTPPFDIASNYYPALGVYSSSSTAVLNEQMAEVDAGGDRRAGRLVVGAGLGGGSASAGRDRGRRAARASPSPCTSSRTRGGASRARSPTSRTCDGLGVRTFYLYRPLDLPAADWAPVNDQLRRPGDPGVRPDGARRRCGNGTFRGRLHLRHARLRRPDLRPPLPAGARARPAVRAVGRAGVRRPAGDGRCARQAAPQRAHVRLDVARGDRRRRRPDHDHLVQRVAGGHADRARRLVGAAAGSPATAPTTARGGCTG